MSGTIAVCCRPLRQWRGREIGVVLCWAAWYDGGIMGWHIGERRHRDKNVISPAYEIGKLGGMCNLKRHAAALVK